VQHHAADQLHVEMSLAQRSLGALANRREGRHEQIVEVLAGGKLVTEHGRARPQLRIGQHLELILERIDLFNPRAVALHAPLVRGAE